MVKPYKIEQVARVRAGQQMPRWPHVTSAVVLMNPDSDDSIFVPLEDGRVEGVSTERGMATSISAAIKAAGMCVTTRADKRNGTEFGIRIWRLQDSAGAGGAARVAAGQRVGMDGWSKEWIAGRPLNPEQPQGAKPKDIKLEKNPTW